MIQDDTDTMQSATLEVRDTRGRGIDQDRDAREVRDTMWIVTREFRDIGGGSQMTSETTGGVLKHEVRDTRGSVTKSNIPGRVL